MIASTHFDSARLQTCEASIKAGVTPRSCPGPEQDLQGRPPKDHSSDLNKAATLRLGLMLAEMDERGALGTASQLGETSAEGAS